MNWKNFIFSFLVGFVVYWFSGGLFYGVLFKSILPTLPEAENPEMIKYILVGCIFMTLLLTYIFNRIGGISSSKEAMLNGAVVCAIVSGAMHSFFYEHLQGWNMVHRLLDIGINAFQGILTASAMYFILHRLNNKVQPS